LFVGPHALFGNPEEDLLQPVMAIYNQGSFLGSPQRLLGSPQWLFVGPHGLFGNPEEDLLQPGRANYNQGGSFTTKDGCPQGAVGQPTGAAWQPTGVVWQPSWVVWQPRRGLITTRDGSPQWLFVGPHALFGNPEEDLLQPGRVNYNQ
jgi:hypothetical protein